MIAGHQHHQTSRRRSHLRENDVTSRFGGSVRYCSEVMFLFVKSDKLNTIRCLLFDVEITTDDFFVCLFSRSRVWCHMAAQLENRTILGTTMSKRIRLGFVRWRGLHCSSCSTWLARLRNSVSVFISRQGIARILTLNCNPLQLVPSTEMFSRNAR